MEKPATRKTTTKKELQDAKALLEYCLFRLGEEGLSKEELYDFVVPELRNKLSILLNGKPFGPERFY